MLYKLNRYRFALIVNVGFFSVKFNEIVQTKLGFALKETFTRNFRSYSDDPKTKWIKEWFKIEKGINSRTDLSYNINKSMKISSKLEIFSNLSTFKEIDARWDSQFRAKLTKFFSINLSVYALYDYDDSQNVQIKQFLGIGFVYNFF